MRERLSQQSDFQGRPLPEPGKPAGYGALIEAWGLRVPLPPRLAAIAERHHPKSTSAWYMLTPRHLPGDTLGDQLEFALKYEGVNLAVLSALFRVIEPQEIEAVVRATPTGVFARRIWWLYEWLTSRTLDLPDAGRIKAVPAVDPGQQFALRSGSLSSRHRVLNNMPGTREFCPMVRRTDALERYEAMDLAARASDVVDRTRRDVVTRAAAFLLLSDSKASFAIEGEHPSPQRQQRWGHAIAQAGSRELSPGELDRLQKIVIGDNRFVELGFRTEGGFVGSHDRLTHEPLPGHISARPEDVRDLVEGIITYDQRASTGGLDPVVAAAVVAFGFVYVHPYVDGNGRIHRWLIHHALARAHYNPPGLVFPISAAILRRIADYRVVLESYSRELLPLVEWRPTERGNIEVLNDTADYYRFFDATAHAEFLYEMVALTVNQDLPEEVAFLEAFERFSLGVKETLEMPDRKVELLRSFLQQGNGTLSRRARDGEFAQLTDDEVRAVEALYASNFTLNEVSPEATAG